MYRARLTKPIQVLVEPQLRNRIVKVADLEGLSMAQVIRDIIWSGIATREALCAQRVGASE